MGSGWRILNHDVLPIIGTFKLKDVTRVNVQALLDRCDRRGAHNMGWQVLKLTRRMLNVAVSRGVLEQNVAVGIERRDPIHRQATRTVGITSCMVCPRDAGLVMADGLKDMLVFQLLTAVRPSEAREMVWPEIDFEQKVWSIPSSE